MCQGNASIKKIVTCRALLYKSQIALQFLGWAVKNAIVLGEKTKVEECHNQGLGMKHPFKGDWSLSTPFKGL